MSKYLSISEEWVKEKVKICGENLEDIKTLILQGNYEEKISCLGTSLLHFSRLKILDLSRNVLKSIRGIEHIRTLEVLNLYYNCIEEINELRVLSFNQNIRDLDLRLNPVSRINSDYRLYLTYILPKLKTLDCRMLRDAERKAAISFFGTDSTVDICPLSMLRKLDDMRSPKASKARLDHSPHFIENTDRPLKCYQNHNKSSLNLDIWPCDGYTTLNNPLVYDVEAYDLSTRSQDPWTSNILRADSKPRLMLPPLDPPRGIKHAEFYNCKERLQTELEFSVLGRKDNVDENGPIIDKNGHQSHKESSERCLTVVPSDVKLGNGPRIPPRGKRFTPSSILSNPNVKKTSVEQDKSEYISELSKHSESSWMRNDYIDSYSNEKIDNAFFLIMKNFIEEAVSESFARYKISELKNNLSKYSSNNGSFTAVPSTTSSTSRIYSTIGKSQSNPHIDVTSNGHTKNTSNHSNDVNSNYIDENKNHTFQEELLNGSRILSLEQSRRPQEKRMEVSEFKQEGNEAEISRRDYFPSTTRDSPKLIQDDNIRNKELECENSRLTAEVERLKTRLKLYEETIPSQGLVRDTIS
ncbi:unnamed protein product [Schistosoma haematobium]|nr:unnamed protein product [Schistosoma haematobium]CAH8652457.1 unnamed protein product [Schistosoma haematobium]